MSSGLTIASVTAVLRTLLANGLARGDVSSQLGTNPVVSALPPDRIETGDREHPQLNLFLYRVTPHLAVPRAPSPTGARQLALELHYLVTAYGAEDLHAEILLGHAIRTFHESSVISRARVEEMLHTLSADASGLETAPSVQALRSCAVDSLSDHWQIIPDVLSNEDMMRLWTALQGKFRPSFTYKVVGAAIEMEKQHTGEMLAVSAAR